MLQQLEPRTDVGRKFVELAEMHSAEIAERAVDHDGDGTFPVEAIESMKQSGFAAGPVPEEFGGMGLASVHDLMVGVNRLGRGDGSAAIAINMHLSTCWIATRILRGARETHDTATATALEGFMTLLGGGTIALANATEPGTDLRHPMTEATRVPEGWRIDGRKGFGTLSPVADVMTVTCRVKRDDGTWGMGRAIVFTGASGQTIMNNWDAMGMRGSGSHDIVYENCVVPAELFADTGDWGEFQGDALLVGTVGSIGLVGAFCGIAEAAREYIAALLQKRTKQPSGRPLAERRGIQHGMAELEVDLLTCQAHLATIGQRLDALFERPVADVTDEDLHQAQAAFQAAKLVVNRKAIDVVDKALQLSGGAGYLSSNPLSRLYRDVRAGPFMQPLSPNEAYEYIGKIALDQPPRLED